MWKIAPKELQENKLRGLLAWVAFYEYEYGQARASLIWGVSTLFRQLRKVCRSFVCRTCATRVKKEAGELAKMTAAIYLDAELEDRNRVLTRNELNIQMIKRINIYFHRMKYKRNQIQKDSYK